MEHNNSYEMEPTYYNTKEELGTPATGVPVQEFSKYIIEMKALKTKFKEQFSVMINQEESV